MSVSIEILEYIANNITSNIRELEGCLIKLLANASLNSVNIDIELTRKVVKEIATDRKVNITIETITKIRANNFSNSFNSNIYFSICSNFFNCFFC